MARKDKGSWCRTNLEKSRIRKEIINIEIEGEIVED